MKRTLSSLILVLAAGCFGGLENAPFEPGTTVVRGVLSGEIDPNAAWVAVVGRPELTSAVAANGAFELTVPTGELELAASTGLGRATRRTLHAYQNRPIEVTLAPEAAVIVAGRVVLEESFSDGAPTTIRVDGLPVSAPAGADGRFRFDSLPFGCHHLIVEHAEFEPSVTDACGESGEVVTTNHHLRHASDHASAACAPCREPSDCASGQCVSYGGEHVCANRCDVNHPCSAGFSCVEVASGVHACVVEAASCSAAFDLLHRAACTGDDQCGLDGVTDGLCTPDHRCSIACATQHDCPEGHHCVIGERSYCD
jgi:hypothetical protein